jgi:hypothetical protein
MRGVGLALLFALVACGGDEGDSAPGAGAGQKAEAPAPAAAQRPEPATLESMHGTPEQEAAMRKMLKWQGSGPEGDLDAAIESCRRAALEAQPPPRPGLPAVGFNLRCLGEKGWKLEPEPS